MSQESDLQGQIDRAWKKIEELRELVGHQGDLLVRTMAMAGIMCFRCGRAMAGTIDASRSFLSFECDRCGAKENYVIPGDMTEKRVESPPESVKKAAPDLPSQIVRENPTLDYFTMRHRVESLERGAKMEATESLDLKLLVGALERRVEELEKTDRIAISGGKECDRRYVEARGRIERLEERTANLEEKPGPDFGPSFRRIEALEKRVEHVYDNLCDVSQRSAIASEDASNRLFALEEANRGDFLRRCSRTATQVDLALNESMAAASPACGTCRWFAESREKLGFCHRNPPLAAREAKMAAFPTVDRRWFCGEHSPQ